MSASRTRSTSSWPAGSATAPTSPSASRSARRRSRSATHPSSRSTATGRSRASPTTRGPSASRPASATTATRAAARRSEEHTSELQSRQYLVCRLLLEKKNGRAQRHPHDLVEGLDRLVAHGRGELGGNLCLGGGDDVVVDVGEVTGGGLRSEEHSSELQ